MEHPWIQKYLHRTFNTLVLALQETHITNFNSLPIPINYTLYQECCTNSYEGAALLIHNSISQRQIPITQDFEATGVSVDTKLKLNITSAYISPTKSFNRSNLENVLCFNSWLIPEAMLLPNS